MSLSLAMTEKHEKAERRHLMDEQHITELEAARIVAKKLQG
jgi:hypothetical protein